MSKRIILEFSLSKRHLFIISFSISRPRMKILLTILKLDLVFVVGTATQLVILPPASR